MLFAYLHGEAVMWVYVIGAAAIFAALYFLTRLLKKSWKK